MAKFYISQRKIITIILLFLLLLFTLSQLISSNNKIEQLENDYSILSDNLTSLEYRIQINNTSQHQHTQINNTDDLVINKLTIQLLPLFDMFLSENNVISDDFQERYEYVIGYFDAWSKYLTFNDTNEMIVDWFNGKSIDEFTSDNNSNPNSCRLKTTFYNKGYSEGTRNAIELYKSIREEILEIKRKYPNKDNWQIDNVGKLNEFNTNDKIIQGTCLQALIILKRIIKTTNQAVD